MEHNQIVEALLRLNPKANWNLIGDDYSEIEWFDDLKTKPTVAEIQAEIDNPTLQPDMTIEQKLATIGLDLDSLKAAINA